MHNFIEPFFLLYNRGVREQRHIACISMLSPLRSILFLLLLMKFKFENFTFESVNIFDQVKVVSSLLMKGTIRLAIRKKKITKGKGCWNLIWTSKSSWCWIYFFLTCHDPVFKFKFDFNDLKVPLKHFVEFYFGRDRFLEFGKEKLLSSIIKTFSRLGVNYSLYWNSIPIFFTNDFVPIERCSKCGCLIDLTSRRVLSLWDSSSQISHSFHRLQVLIIFLFCFIFHQIQFIFSTCIDGLSIYTTKLYIDPFQSLVNYKRAFKHCVWSKP